MDSVKKVFKIACKTVPEPNMRNLQLVYTPQQDEEMENFTFLLFLHIPCVFFAVKIVSFLFAEF